MTWVVEAVEAAGYSFLLESIQAQSFPGQHTADFVRIVSVPAATLTFMDRSTQPQAPVEIMSSRVKSRQS